MIPTAQSERMAPQGKARKVSLGGALPFAQGFTTGERIVWSELLFDISRAGFKDTEIARKVGVAPTTINGLKNGAWIEPKYSLGAALIELHHKLQEAGKIKRPHDR